jgi:hypothetical protein
MIILEGGVGEWETRRQGDKETRRQGDKETRRQGDKEEFIFYFSITDYRLPITNSPLPIYNFA